MVIRELLAFASGVFLLYVRILPGIHRDIFLSFLLTLCVLFLCCPSPRLMGQIFVVPSDAVPPKERSRPARHTQVVSE